MNYPITQLLVEFNCLEVFLLHIQNHFHSTVHLCSFLPRLEQSTLALLIGGDITDIALTFINCPHCFIKFQ